jgi:uncharacterized protein (DUF58 family)
VSLILRILYRFYRLFSWLRYVIQRRFTHAGLTVLVALMATALMGLDTENTVAYQAFTLLLFLLVIAISFSWFFRAPFAATRRLPRFGTVGHPLNYLVTVTNLAVKGQNGLLLLEDLADSRPSFQEWQAVQRAQDKRVRSFRFDQPRMANPFKLATLKQAAVPSLPPKQQVDVAVEVTPLRRGLLRFTGLTLLRPDPLGLFSAMAKISLPQTALILPKRYLLPPIALPGRQKYQAGGVAMASNVGQSEEFVALRDYRHGDPVRHIHWRSWAKTGKPVVKEFEDEFFVRHALVLDTFAQHPHRDVFEEAVSVTASFACSIRTQESLLDLLFVGRQSFCFTAGRGLAHADQMLEVLASVSPCGENSFAALEHLVLNHTNLVSGCICVLVAWNDERRVFIQKLRALGVPLLVLLIVPPGQSPAPDPGPMRDEPDRFFVLEAGRIEAGLAKLRS